MSTPDPIVAESIKGGRARADALVARRRKAVQARAAAGPPRYLIAEGDSWFDYPLFHDILEALESDHNFRIRSSAHLGDTAESMAYEDNQLDKTRRVFEELAEDNADGSKTPKAVLISCGGNDVAGIFAVLLNHSRAQPLLPVLNEPIVQGLLDVRVKAAISSLIASVNGFAHAYFSQSIPILIHGYGFPVPDGRGFPVLNLAGPWLKPGFAAKGYVTADPQSDAELQANADVMKVLIKRFNDMLASVAQQFGGVVKHVDLSGVFSNVVAGKAYQGDWRDEMHATTDAYKRAAQLIASNI
jgi:hypothetical protein